VSGVLRGQRRRRDGIVVVGSGTLFISGLTHYTRYVASALSEHTPTSVILMRKLIPRAFYPGKGRVGDVLTEASYPADMEVLDGVDWYWIPSIFRALRFLRRHQPEAVLLQWWTGAVLHTYIVLAVAAKLRGARVLVEVHEIQDTGEAQMIGARRYVQLVGRGLMWVADGFIVHSEHDRVALGDNYPVGDRPVKVARHGPYSHYSVADAEPLRHAPPEAINILFFGTIRPYKGLEDLVRAFEMLASGVDSVWLTVVGETWENWTEPTDLISRSPVHDRITLVNRYVSDAEASRWFAGADIVALPYRRSSASGPLHMAMDAGLPVVLSDVGGLREASAGYKGVALANPEDPADLHRALLAAIQMRGRRFVDSGSWDETAATVLDLVNDVRTRR